jgi:hypothetical protein
LRVYIIGSLRLPLIREVAATLRADGHDVHDDWHAAGERSDDIWKEYEQGRGRTFVEALKGRHAQNVFEYDKKWLDWAEAVVLVLPAGRSGHLELGYSAGQGKRTHILLDGSEDRWDVMYKFADQVHDSLTSLKEALNGA